MTIQASEHAAATAQRTGVSADAGAPAARTANAGAMPMQRPPGPPVLRLTGRKVVGGVAEGEALVTHDHVSGWGGVDPRTGTIVETHHELRGQSFAGKVLIFPGAKGSSGWSATFHLARLMHKAPAAMVFTEMTTKIALGAVVTRAPALTDFDQDPIGLIRTGDWVRVDADAGVLEVYRR